MNVLTVWESDGTSTRINVPVDDIAYEMATFLRTEIGLYVTVTILDAAIVKDKQETERANRYIDEWREFGRRLAII